MTVILHLFSNHKRTGPADLALALAAAQSKRDGIRALFLSPDPERTPVPETAVQTRARALGLEEPDLAVALPKHFRPLAIWRDTGRIRRWLAEDALGKSVDVVHCHLRGDHLTGGRAARKVVKVDGSRTLLVVRSFYDAAGGTRAGTREDGAEATPGWRDRYALARLTDGLIASAPSIAEAAQEVFSVPPGRVVTIEPGIDVLRFDPDRPLATDAVAAGKSPRAAHGIPEDAFVVGVIARVQAHRRFEVILAAIKRLRDDGLDARLLVMGRGTRLQEVGIDPARALGLDESTAIFPGYVDGDGFCEAIRAMDCVCYLVPGTDGTCRAVREGMAAGKATIASQRGTLPEIVADEETGLLIEDRDDDPDAPAALAAALRRLADDPAGRAAMGAAALARARARFGLDAMADDVLAAYDRFASLGLRL